MKTFTNQMNWFDQKNQLNQKINLIFKNQINRLKKKTDILTTLFLIAEQYQGTITTFRSS